MSTPNRTLSDVGRQASNSSSKPKRKGKPTPPVANGASQTNGGPFSENATFSDSTAMTPPKAVTPTPSKPVAPPPKASTPTQKKKAKAVAKAKRRNRQTTTFSDQVVRFIAIAFILFTINKCHNDTELKSPVCQAVQQRILQPFVINPFNAFVAHPSVAPMIQSVTPVYVQAVEASQPLVRQVRKVYITRIAPHVAHLEKKARPYIRNLQLHYARSVAPYVRTAQIYYTRLEHAVEPYVNQGIAALLRLWFEIQPKLIPLIEESKFIPDWVREHALIPLLQLREQYVDTHVYKMLQTVEEFGESRDTKSLKAENHITQTATTTAVPTSSTPATDAVHSLTTAAPEVIEIEPTVITITPEAITPDGPIIPPGPIIPDGPIIPTGPIIPDGPIILDAPSTSTAAAATASPDEDDVEAWLAELRADVPTTSATREPEPAQPTEETEEEIAERERLKQIETARKRADLEQRHAKFEHDIHELGRSAVEDLQIFLDAVRGVAAADLNRRAREHVTTLKNEAEKSLKGTDAYLNKLKGAAQGGAIKVALFDDVCEKVEKRFLDTAQNVSGIVSAWWSEMREEEQKEASISLANIAADAIKALALEAQSDLGMDYAWLDDVTVADWSRYHALVDYAEAYSKELQDLVDGTHPNSEPNPLEKGLGELQGLLNGMIDDFHSKHKIQHDNGIASFGSVNPDTPADTKQSPFSFPPGAAAREDASILQRGKEEVEAAIKRAEAEVGTAAENIQAIFGDGVKQAEEAAHQATRSITKAVGGTPSPENFQETAEYVAAKVSESAAAHAAGASAAAQSQYEDISARYDQAVSHASQAIHDATRSVIRAAGYTPEPETPKEHAESIVAQASSTLASVVTAVSSAGKDAASSASSLYSGASVSVSSAYSGAASAAASVYSDAGASAHQATRSLSRAAGATPTPETPSETVESISAVVGEHVESLASAMASSASVVASSASSVYNEATRTVIKAAGGTPSPTNIHETAESLVAGAQAYYTDAAAHAQAYYAEAAAKLPSYEDLKSRATSLVERSKALLGAEPAPAGYEKLLNEAFELINEYHNQLDARTHWATRAASRVVGATPTPESFEEHVKSVVSGASGAILSATEAVRSMVHEDL
ncbi:hypothetical protein FRC10_009849 [Ceratobasidium sp. 414]|nr:hypothetical protein FRC10_009849 [Ceratobasidium sp. 414]